MSFHTEDDFDELAAEPYDEDDDGSRDSNDEDDDENETNSTNTHNHHDRDDRSTGSDDRPDTPAPSEAASEAVIVEAEDADDDEEILTATAIIETSADGDSAKKRKRPGPKPKRKRIESDRVEAAAEARAMLQHTVKRLPMVVGENYVVRTMGRICTDDQRFSNSQHIYPVGFSCDRYEFSPVHGRVLKLRCTVLDGRTVRSKQKELRMEMTAPFGPIFRIMWGGGIDDENESLPEYRYDITNSSPPITKDSYPLLNDNHMGPEEGMRVRVKYERDQWYSGTIVEIDENLNGEFEIVIQYDDGSTEHAVYPDSDITLFRPGAEDEFLDNGNLEVTEMNGKPVTSIVATSAMEAWGKALLAMGLMDEVTFEQALGVVEGSRCKKQTGSDIADSFGEDVNEIEMEREEETEEELELRQKIKAAKVELERARSDDQEAAIELADARLTCIGPFLCNPFQDKDAQYVQQVSWLTTVIRKEKAKMGSTGNKKKVVTAIDLLERNDTFFNTDVESLVEGLPGSEMLSSYRFHSFRVGFIPSAISEAWQQRRPARPPRQSEIEKKKPLIEAKPPKQSTIDLEREVKRQRRDDERDSRKRQKDEEVEQKKKARTDERLTRLSIQVDERLFKEACFQREKVVVAMARSLSREYNRRKKAAELIAMQSVMDDSNCIVGSLVNDSPQLLSPLCQVYDEEVLRCWDFVTSYGDALVQWGYLDKLPSLNSIQNALDALGTEDRVARSRMSRSEAIACLIDLCIALCKPLAVSLTRLLFASLIALNPVLQKDFGAAFFAEVRTNATKEEADGPSSSDLLPVNTLTWQEVARLAFLSDALGELGNQKHEIAHVLRGYRSMGHPNSKEAKRLRRTEDFPIATIRQVISQGASVHEMTHAANEARVRVLAPRKPSCEPPSWLFYLHNIKGLNAKNISLLKHNLRKAIDSAKSPEVIKTLDEKTIFEMEKAMAVIEKVVKIKDPTPPEVASCNKARASILRLLDTAAQEVFSTDSFEDMAHRDINDVPLETNAIPDGFGPSARTGMKVGPRRDFVMNEKLYKEICHAREQYMSDALALKDEMEHQDEDADDDDDDDDENGKESLKEKEINLSEAGQENSTADSPDETKPDPQLSELVATVVENGDETVKNDVPARIGKVTPYDDFCADIPTAHELIRRCLAVLRVLSQTNAAEPFIYPVDPQTNPGYYESILYPMCLREVGKRLIAAAKEHTHLDDRDKALSFVESTVAKFARNIRLIAQNCSCYPSAGATVISASDELLRIFERLLLDWVLAPRSVLQPIEDLDDDKCVEFHDSDDDSLVLLCDGCEGKYNMGRLDPPLRDVPKGDWFCPRCLSGRCWESLDPRNGKVIMRTSENGETESWTIKRAYFLFSDDPVAKPSLHYNLVSNSGVADSLPVNEVDLLLDDQGTPVEPVHCLEGLSECPGYSQGPNHGVYDNLVPVAANPNVSDAAAQAFISSSVFQDTMNGSSSFMLVNPEDLQASEWSRLLTLLVMKCASSEMMNSLASKLEADAAEKMSKVRNESSRLDVHTIFPLTNADEIDTIQAEIGSQIKGQEEIMGSQENSDALAVFVDPAAIEVVNDASLDISDLKSPLPISVASNAAEDVEPDGVLSEEVQRRHARTSAIEEKDKRFKLREENLVALNIKSQLRHLAASFEEDNVSLVVDSSLGSREKGLNMSSTRCRALSCDFCGLSDTALGSPLLRVPNMSEWYDLMPHMARNRRVFLTADVGDRTTSEGKNPSWPSRSKGKSIVAVTIRVGGELISVPDESLFEGFADGGLMEYLPRNVDGFQCELSSRYEVCVPFVSGSLSAHESCAIAAHNARKERVVNEHKTKAQVSQDRDAGILCGRTLSLARDSKGRSYWKFKADEALFVCDSDDTNSWRRYEDADVIASIIVSLGKEPIVNELKRVFPSAARLLKGRQWTQMLLKRQFCKKTSSFGSDNEGNAAKESLGVDDNDVEQDEPYQPGEDVLVESKCGRMLWEAEVLSVSNKNDTVNGYRVRYKGWSSRFDEWVTPFRVVEPIDSNVAIQSEMVHELQRNAVIVPDTLRNMNSCMYINSSDRARNGASIPDFAEVSKVPPLASSGERAFALAKASLLMIESALPRGSIDHTSKGSWRPEIAAEWRNLVLTARGPYTLMGCVFALEENIDPEWIDPHVTHLLSCLPQRWKAIREATYSSLCLRITMLDQGVLYNNVDMLKYVPKGRREEY